MKPLPESRNSIIIRTDYSSDERFNEIRAMIAQPIDGFVAYVDYAEDPSYDALSREDVIELFAKPGLSYAMIIDAQTLSDPEHPLLVIDVFDEEHPQFRAVPAAIQSIENNLSIANMDFADFADAVDPDGVFRNYRFER